MKSSRLGLLLASFVASACSDDEGANSADSMVAAGNGFVSLGITPLPGRVVGVDDKANLNITAIEVAADGSIRNITTNGVQSQQDKLAINQWGRLSGGKFIDETVDTPDQPTGIAGEKYYSHTFISDIKTGAGTCTCGTMSLTIKMLDGSSSAIWTGPVLSNYYQGKLDSYYALRGAPIFSGGSFHALFPQDSALGITRITGSTVTEETVATFPSAFYSADAAQLAIEPSGKAYATYCETVHSAQGGVQTKALVVATREAGATTWTEATRQADACPTGQPTAFTAANGVARIVTTEVLSSKITIVESSGATAFTKTEITVPTTEPLNIEGQDGKIHVGFSDSNAGGKATIARIENGTLVTVGKAGFTKDAALVAPRYRSGRLFGVLVNKVAIGLEFVEQK